MARHCWPGQSAIGKRLHVGSPQKRLPWATVIGVVADTRFGARDEPVISQWFAPESQPATLDGYGSAGKLSDAAGGNITIRSKLPAQQITQILRSVMSEIDPMLALEQAQTMEAVISSTRSPAEIQHLSHHRFRRWGAVAHHHRHLCGGCIFGLTADPRNCYPDGYGGTAD